MKNDDKKREEVEKIVELAEPLNERFKAISDQIDQLKTDIIKTSTKAEGELNKMIFFLMISMNASGVHHSLEGIADFVKSEINPKDK